MNVVRRHIERRAEVHHRLRQAAADDKHLPAGRLQRGDHLVGARHQVAAIKPAKLAQLVAGGL